MSRPYPGRYTKSAGAVPNAKTPICQLLQECDWQEEIQLKVDFEQHSIWCWGLECAYACACVRAYSQSYDFSPPCAFMAWCRLSKVTSLPLLFCFFFLNFHTVRWGLYFLQFQSLNFIEMGTGKFEETKKFTVSFNQKWDWGIPNW